MRTSARGSICRGLLMVVGLAFAAAPAAGAENAEFLEESLASLLLQSRAQLRIFRYDDQKDLNCQNRRFVKAKVVHQPRVVSTSREERKWIERWVLNRCGTEVSYHVYFTDVGDGGAFFSFKEVTWGGALAGEPVAD